jgi:hypothetical protein
MHDLTPFLHLNFEECINIFPPRSTISAAPGQGNNNFSSQKQQKVLRSDATPPEPFPQLLADAQVRFELASA